MTIQGAIYELNNILSSNDIPCYWKPVIKKIIETVEQNVREMSEQTDGDLIPRQAVITMLNKIENAVEDGDGFQFNEWIDYAKDIPSAEKTDGDLITEINKLPRIKVGNSNSPTVKYCIDEVLLYDLLEHYKAENTANKININEYVKVKLTDYGKEIFYHQYDEINSFYKCEKIKPHYPKIDKEGYTSFQLWHFMNLYGNYIDMGMQNVIEPLEIVFESAEKTAEWIDLGNAIQCSNCETLYPKVRVDLKHYCERCGSRMKGVE